MLNFCSFSFFYDSAALLGLRLHTVRHTTLGSTPVDEWPVRRKDLYLTTYNTYKRQTSMPPARFEPATPVSEQPQTPRLRPRDQWVQRTYAVNTWNHITACTGGFKVCANLPFSCSSLGLHLGSPERCLALWIPTAAAPSSRRQRRWCTEEWDTAPTPSRGGTSSWWHQTSWRFDRTASSVLYHLWKWCIISAWYLLPSFVILVQVQSNSVLTS